jgi:hypothetical protein
MVEPTSTTVEWSNCVFLLCISISDRSLIFRPLFCVSLFLPYRNIHSKELKYTSYDDWFKLSLCREYFKRWYQVHPLIL